MEIPAIVILGIVIVVFIAGGLVWAFIVDRRRNKQVARDPERVEPDQGSESFG